jgi:hypothetical protein
MMVLVFEGLYVITCVDDGLFLLFDLFDGLVNIVFFCDGYDLVVFEVVVCVGEDVWFVLVWLVYFSGACYLLYSTLHFPQKRCMLLLRRTFAFSLLR